MFDIISRLRPIVLDAYIANAAIYEQFPIVQAKEDYPEWWKRMDNIAYGKPEQTWGIPRPQATIKRCDGLIDLYKKAINIPLWSDFIIKIENRNITYINAGETDAKITFHDRAQFNIPEFEDFVHAKVMVPWIFKEKTGVLFELCHPVWNNLNNLNNFTVMPGLLNYRDQGGAHCNMLIPAKKDNLIYLNAGEPIMQLIPITERPVKVVNHLVSQEELHNLTQSGGYTSDWYGRYKKAVKRRAKSPTCK
jgi:hypothetical protein